jgi:hypothetical protein
MRRYNAICTECNEVPNLRKIFASRDNLLAVKDVQLDLFPRGHSTCHRGTILMGMQSDLFVMCEWLSGEFVWQYVTLRCVSRFAVNENSAI